MGDRQKAMIIEESNRRALGMAHEYGCHVCTTVVVEIVQRLDSIITGPVAKQVAEILYRVRQDYIKTINENYLQALREVAVDTDRRLADD